jgi:hypothetical protein
VQKPNHPDLRTHAVDGEPVARWVAGIEFRTSLGQPVECQQPEAHDVQGLPVVCEDPEHATASRLAPQPEPEAEP